MSLGQTVQQHTIAVLNLKEFVAAEEETAVRQVVEAMRRGDRSTALITNGGRLTGIFTERDVLRKVLTAPGTWDRPIRELMTPDPVAVTPETSILGAVRLMNEGHFRDLPVVRPDGQILGNVTDNAIVRHLADHLAAEVLNLPPDPNQVPKTVEGA